MCHEAAASAAAATSAAVASIIINTYIYIFILFIYTYEYLFLFLLFSSLVNDSPISQPKRSTLSLSFFILFAFLLFLINLASPLFPFFLCF
jgi:hypothetical protein